SPSRSRLLASSYSMMAPKSAACLARAIIRSGPWMPPGNPGKFSTSVVVMSAPPWLTEPAMTRGGEACPAGIDGRSVAGWAGPYDEQLVGGISELSGGGHLRLDPVHLEALGRCRDEQL